MTETTELSTVIVDGDVTMDWNLADLGPKNGETSSWSGAARSRMCWQRGGAALVADLIEASINDIPGSSVQTRELPTEPVRSNDPRFHHAYAMWRRDRKGKWRVHDFLGVDPRRAGISGSAIETGGAVPELVVIDDAALGFRDTEAAWPPAIRNLNEQTWILFKTASPVATGGLWDHLLRTCPQRLIVLMTVDDLRRTEVQISRGLSWERTAQDVVWELVHNPCVNGLSRCAHSIVSFGTAGAVLHSAAQPAARLIFDSPIMEGEWEGAGCGQMIGNTATLTAALARQIIVSGSDPDIVKGIQSGIHATRALFETGYKCESAQSDGLDVAFPIEKIANAIRAEPVRMAAVAIQDPVRFLSTIPTPAGAPNLPGFWTVLEDRYRDGLLSLSESIVLDGLEESLLDVPVGRIGLLTTVDRHEIESARSIQSLMREYCRHRQKQPLSIAVFGPPGSGKSFGVEQVANSIEPGLVRTLTFNLSQFDDPGDLLGALHQIRDVGLTGKLPLVFWDEFDSALNEQRLGWLRYFLAPMQDGAFQEGQITHPIGRSIFVFAGGTSATMSEFSKSLNTDDERKSVKLPDFVSRLKGFLNVLGPNPQPRGAGGRDPYYVVRRAILLRSLLERTAGHLLRTDSHGKQQTQIDTGVLRALLQVSRYKHGIRSITSILAMSELAGRRSFQRSSLPAESQLDLHVDGREFLSLVQSIVLTDELVERLAEAAHDIWRAGKERDGWRHGPDKDEKLMTHPWMVPYTDPRLPPQGKEANRVTVRTIPEKLSVAGYVMVPARSNEPALEFPGSDLETLAELEHELWMQARLDAGFRLGSPTEEDPLFNEHLVPWAKVPDKIKEADRDLIRGIPTILSNAGYAIVKLNEDAGQ